MRGRPKGSGTRSTDFSDAQVWARVEFICWRDKVKVNEAVKIMAAEGWMSVVPRDGKPSRIWLSREVTENDSAIVRELEARLEPGHSRNTNPAARFRTIYFKAKRRRGDLSDKGKKFRESGDFWLRTFKAAHKAGKRLDEMF